MNWENLLKPGRFDLKDKQVATLDNSRSEFERDYDRIIFSAPFRNLQDKTQVFPLPEHDFVHTRLTHSLEVSSVGRSLGKIAGEYLLSTYPTLSEQGITSADIGAIVAAAALTHDIGNPPFGHSGEDAISDFFKFHQEGQQWKGHLSASQWADMVNFEGNAQGFRMLTAKNSGLKISFATLAAFTKYPRPSDLPDPEKGRRSQKKFGFFHDQLAYYSLLADNLGITEIRPQVWLRHPLAFLVEAADDICYSIIDLEDGCTLGLVSLEESIRMFAAILGDRFSEEKLKEYKGTSQKLAILRAMAINKLVRETADAFIEKEEAIRKGTFDQALTDYIPSAIALEEISRISVAKIYRSKPVLEKEAAGFQVLEGLLDVFSKALYHKFYQPELYSGQDKSILRLLPEAMDLNEYDGSDAYAILRGLVDFISGMTDKYALSLYRKVKGISLPGA
ncbi:dNTP triphosphohydrolase [Litoribacter ruber]|uniref:DNTP triphosphohydrolase n=2 Tax=Litoribacter ruber TaxID=702568 RepID=A0AAP2G0X8_9BACT|nr:dNTP triphosphohydrolase [Litoribacter alkaliphilus]MBT0812168.1 dNTP triphosphohydrolase [Litoribacter ruber]